MRQFYLGRNAGKMNKTRLEAFSDAVIAIIMTIMVLELKIPHDPSINALKPLAPVFLTYVLSFINLGIYWNNHHHMLQVTHHIGGGVLWANINLLFWLSLFPFVTGWMGENHLETAPTAVYGVVMVMAALAYTILQTTIISHAKGENKLLAQAVGRDRKGKISIVCYIAAIALAFLNTWLSVGLFAIVALLWLIPDRRIERKISHNDHPQV